MNTQPEEKNLGGRPPKFSDKEMLQKQIDDYFAGLFDEEGKLKKPATITGLALALDTTRETLCDYAEKPAFSDTIKRAKTRVEQFAEEQLYLGKNAAGPIFALKNFGWSDKQQIDHTTKGESINLDPREAAKRMAFLLTQGVDNKE